VEHYHESISRTMYEPERGYIGFSGDFVEALTTTAERAAQGVGRVREAWENPSGDTQDSGNAKKGLPTGVWVLIGVGGLLIAFGLGKRR